jgi:hypothetical protein
MAIHEFQGSFTVMTRLPWEVMTAKEITDGITERWITMGNENLRVELCRLGGGGISPNRDFRYKNFAALAATHFYPLSRILSGIDTNTFSAMLTTDDHEILNKKL